MSNIKVQSSKECQISNPTLGNESYRPKGTKIITLLPLQGGGQEGDGVLGKCNG